MAAAGVSPNGAANAAAAITEDVLYSAKYMRCAAYLDGRRVSPSEEKAWLRLGAIGDDGECDHAKRRAWAAEIHRQP